MEATILATYCNVAEVTHIEEGRQEGKIGHWFKGFSQRERFFVTDEEIYGRVNKNGKETREVRRDSCY